MCSLRWREPLILLRFTLKEMPPVLHSAAEQLRGNGSLPAAATVGAEVAVESLLPVVLSYKR